MAFSNNSGGTLTLSSPSQVHHVDAAASVRSLRRSLSRSPSKFRLLRSDSHNSGSSDSSYQMPSPDSPCPQPHVAAMEAPVPLEDTDELSTTPTGTPQHISTTSLFATPLRSGMRLSLRSARPKTTSSKPITRPRLSPRSPLKRALNASSDSGNIGAIGNMLAVPPRTAPSTTVSEPLLGQENSSTGKFSNFLLQFGANARNAVDKPSRHSMHLDLSGDSPVNSLAASVTSPLKRTDATTDFDQATFGSPVAKRRSLHGISGLGSDFSVFDFASPNMDQPKTTKQAPSPFEIHEDGSHEYQLAASTTPSSVSSPSPSLDPLPSSSTPSAMQKRSSSLRKSTLQQRHDPRSSWGRRQGEKYLAMQQQQQQQQDQSPHPSKRANDWLFTTHHVRNKPRASLDQLLKPEPRESPFKAKGPLPNPSVHVLDRHTSSGASAVPAPTSMDHRPHPLSRTLTTSSSSSSMPDDSPTHFPVQLPPDRPRPTSIFARSLPLNAHRPKPEPIGTPQYKSARPLQSVFASAGLVSKMNRNAEDEASQRGGLGRTMVMPDTPCKKQVYPSNTYPPSSGSGHKRQQRRFLFSTGSDTPFNSAPVHSRASSTNNNESVVNFFKLRSSHTRKASLLSLEGDIGDSQGTVDGFDLPPTPTKSVLAKNLFGSGHKSHITTTPIAIRDLNTSTNSTAACSTTPAGLPIAIPNARSPPGNISPKTPRESSIFHNASLSNNNMAPPDASRLSISTNVPDSSSAGRPASFIFPPATPTADREAFANFVDRRVSITPVHGAAPSDVDAALSSMFGKVESVGKGEFSQVFRVTGRYSFASSGTSDYFGATPSKSVSSGPGSSSPTAQQVFAVKKIRLPFYGQSNREAKLREVAALEAVRNCENVLQIFDHWEQNGNLYIQTEYCDEGGLDIFLKRVGEHGRLDDFRIWKILLEMSQGLRYVHDAGFIHLDLKPANVLVTYEGHLKIGDFGMAAQWPAAKGIEGEGDREYIGPEILQGKYDKPADVFSLGLIVLEIACNVFLPDNGPIWVALREGDMSVVPSLTVGKDNALARDSSGMPIVSNFDSEERYNLANSLDLASTPNSPALNLSHSRFSSGSIFGSFRRKAIGSQNPPEFMVDQTLPGSLDSVVAWLINPEPASRPTIHQILETDSLQWIHGRRRAPATIFEGNWGPEEDISREVDTEEADTEMTDV